MLGRCAAEVGSARYVADAAAMQAGNNDKPWSFIIVLRSPLRGRV